VTIIANLHLTVQTDTDPEDRPVNFTDPQQITVGQIRPGDFVIEIPTQQNVRGIAPRSAARTAEADWTRWERRIGRRGRMSICSAKLTFVSYPGSFNVPADFTATVRRPVEG